MIDVSKVLTGVSVNGEDFVLANHIIEVAELPNTTFKLYDNAGTLLKEKTTDPENGGSVRFAVADVGTYTVKAYDISNNELWTKDVVVDKIGVYNCKSGKALENYTPAEINIAAKNHYAKYMWSVGDSKNINILGSSKEFVIAGFEHDNKADGSGKSGLTFVMQILTYSSYAHSNTGNNEIGWEGSLIRQNGLKSGDVYYIRDTMVTSSTAGTYYIFDETTNVWVAKSLPTDFDATEYYYTQNTMIEDGAFITGLPDFKDYIVPVLKETADAGKNYKKIIKSSDQIFLLSDAEVFGNDNRYSRYSRYELEGNQYEYFKNNWQDGKVGLGSYWFRSPYSDNAACFCYIYHKSSIDRYGANYTSHARLGFCL